MNVSKGSSGAWHRGDLAPQWAPTRPSRKWPNAPADLPANCFDLLARGRPLVLAAEAQPGCVTLAINFQTRKGPRRPTFSSVRNAPKTADECCPCFRCVEGTEGPTNGRRTPAFVHLFPQGCGRIRAATEIVAGISISCIGAMEEEIGNSRSHPVVGRVPGARAQPSLRLEAESGIYFSRL